MELHRGGVAVVPALLASYSFEFQQAYFPHSPSPLLGAIGLMSIISVVVFALSGTELGFSTGQYNLARDAAFHVSTILGQSGRANEPILPGWPIFCVAQLFGNLLECRSP
jgi:hypothetical protein